MAITPSPRVHRGLGEQPAYVAPGALARSDFQSPYRAQQAADTATHPTPSYGRQLALLDRQRSTDNPADELKEVQRKYNRLKTRYAEMMARGNTLQIEQVIAQRDTYVEERDRYQRLAREQTNRCQFLEQEAAECKRELQSEQRRHRALEQDFRAMHEELNRARATIKIQCEKIEGRIDSTLVRRPTDLVVRDNRPPPPPTKRFGENYGFGIRQVADPRESLYELEPARVAPSTALTIRPKDTEHELPWASELNSLFLRIEEYCRTYLDLAIDNTDDQWQEKIACDVVEESSVTHVNNIANSSQVRHLLLLRHIIVWMINHYFHARMAKGFSAETDRKMHDIRSQVKEDNPIGLVRTLAQAEAKTIGEIAGASGFDSWRAGQIRRDVEIMTTRLQEAIVPRAPSPPPLGKALEAVLAEGWRVGFRMVTCVDKFNFTFPIATPDTKFDPRVMLNRDPFITGPPTELERRGARVALGVTPHITVKSLLTAKMEERSVHMANVLLNWSTAARND
ncbi:MAG: hypothetical protein Q9169_001397 [Polycauliona sp. 2 TL-2023]